MAGFNVGRTVPPTTVRTISTPSHLSLNRALLLAITATLVVALVPAGIGLDRRLARSLELRSLADLDLAPRLLADRSAAYSSAMMMYAKEFSHAPGLAEAVMRGDQTAIASAIEAARPSLGGGVPLVVDGRDSSLVGPRPEKSLIDATRAGQMPVAMSADGTLLNNVALAPLAVAGRWVGAAGVATPVDAREAEALSGLSQSDVAIIAASGDAITASTLDSGVAAGIHRALEGRPAAGAVELTIDGETFHAVSASLGDAGSALFVRHLDEELAVLPALRRTALWSVAAALAIAVLLGSWFSRRISRPVRELAAAADAMRLGRFDAPLPVSRLAEVARVAERFDEMRRALAARLDDLRVANDTLQDRNARLTALQSDLMQRERLAAAGRLVAQLAHEIRNPVASLRNCLELIRRRVTHDREAVEFADLAIDELLRMHELAEQMLDVSRPRDAEARCRPAKVAADVARLVTAGIPSSTLAVPVEGSRDAEVAMAGDALKQVLLNLVQNAREATAAEQPDAGGTGGTQVRVTVDEKKGRGTGGTHVRVTIEEEKDRVRILVDDNGPGIDAALHERIFDPFFSTKSDLHGVGLGLFVAEGLVRGAGGRLSAGPSPLGGARFCLELPRHGSLAAAPGAGTAAMVGEA
jgi:signal transduction histidine kinase